MTDVYAKETFLPKVKGYNVLIKKSIKHATVIEHCYVFQPKQQGSLKGAHFSHNKKPFID